MGWIFPEFYQQLRLGLGIQARARNQPQGLPAPSSSSWWVPRLSYKRTKKICEVKNREEFGLKMFFPLVLSSTWKLENYVQDPDFEKASSPLHEGCWNGIWLQVQHPSKLSDLLAPLETCWPCCDLPNLPACNKRDTSRPSYTSPATKALEGSAPEDSPPGGSWPGHFGSSRNICAAYNSCSTECPRCGLRQRNSLAKQLFPHCVSLCFLPSLSFMLQSASRHPSSPWNSDSHLFTCTPCTPCTLLGTRRKGEGVLSPFRKC